MNTIVIELLRNGQTVNQLLQKGVNYIALCGSLPAKDFTIDCDQRAFDDHVKLLRYDNTDEVSRQLGIQFFQQLISGIIDQIYPINLVQNKGNDILHLRLVTTPKEIAQLPFEMALTPLVIQNRSPQLPFFLNEEIKTTFTREVRRISFDHYRWPFKPRILFAWAQPNNTVPWEQHLDTFIGILRPWALPLKTSVEPVPDVGSLITVLQNATPESIKAEVTKALNEKNPYTHVHLLAHGSKNTDPEKEQFLLVLNNDDKAEKSFLADGDMLAKSLMIEKDGKIYTPQVVSLVACDSGNIGSPVNPAGSICHSLHQAGIPCVFASQFPLTQEGSVKLVTSLYTQLLQSSDPRMALYDTRVALQGDKIHDWASLVAYARFPEDIDEQMKDTSLKIMLQFMKTSNALADHIIRNINNIKKEKIDGFFKEVDDRLDSSIENLTGLIEKAKNDALNKERHAEHYGLIGSAYKRKAEHLFRVAEYNNNITPASQVESRQALENARDWYYKGYKYLNSHWNGAQYLALSTFLNDAISSEEKNDIWILCKIMAFNDVKNANDDESLAWAYGTLAELYLLKPFIIKMALSEQDHAFAEAKKYLQNLNVLQGQEFPKESTARQFERYINWWPVMFDSEITSQLKLISIELRKELPDL